jgi:hypothetical protein
MKEEKIPKEDLIQKFESGFLPYESERMKEELRAKVHRLLKFMDKMDICEYDKSIGEQFICSESKNRDVSAHSLTREIDPNVKNKVLEEAYANVGLSQPQIKTWEKDQKLKSYLKGLG